MPQTTRLFEASDLSSLLQAAVARDVATTVERVVWGWLKPVLDLDVRPDPVPDEVFSWAVELGAIAHENPAGLSAYQLADENTQYSSERRDEILALAASGGQPASGGAPPSPTGCFPAVLPEPLDWLYP